MLHFVPHAPFCAPVPREVHTYVIGGEHTVHHRNGLLGKQKRVSGAYVAAAGHNLTKGLTCSITSMFPS